MKKILFSTLSLIISECNKLTIPPEIVRKPMVRRTKVNQFTEIRLILETKWGDDALVTSVHITFVYIVGYNKNIQC